MITIIHYTQSNKDCDYIYIDNELDLKTYLLDFLEYHGYECEENDLDDISINTLSDISIKFSKTLRNQHIIAIVHGKPINY